MTTKAEFTKEDTAALKGIAIIIMFFHHCFLEKERYEGFDISFAPFSEEFMISFAVFAKVCVGIFVFLSAYGITISVKRKCGLAMNDSRQVAALMCRRIWRIWTGFWPVFLLCIAGTFVLGPEQLEVYGQGLQGVVYGILDALGLAKILGTPTLMGTWWYLSLAIIQVLLMPLLILLYEKLGGLWLILMSLLLPLGLKLHVTDIVRWMPIMVMGLWCADKNNLVKIKNGKLFGNSKWVDSAGKFLIAFGLFYVAFIGKNSEPRNEFFPFLDLISAAAVIGMAVLVIIDIPGLRRVLVLLGKHSMNMFLFHSFIRTRWFHDFTYSFRYWWLILIILLIDSLLFSVVLEWVKKILRYQKIVDIWETK